MIPMYYHTDNGIKTVLVGEPARKLTPVLMITEHGLTVKKVPNTDARFMTPAPTTCRSDGGLVRLYRSIGHRLGISKSAKLFLRSAT